VSAILPDLNLEEVVEFAAEEQFDCVEVMCWPVGKADRKFAGVTHIEVEQFDEGHAKWVNEMFGEHGVSISALGYYPNILSADTKHGGGCADHLKRVIDAAAVLGLSTVNTFIGRDQHKNMDDNLKRFAEVWPPIIAFAEERGIRVGIENCPMLFTNDEWPGGQNLATSPSAWRRMFEAIPSENFGLNFDPSHFVWQMMDYVQPMVEFKDRLFHVHAKDLKIETDKLNDVGIMGLGWSTPKVPGLGDVNWNKFVSALTDVGYDGPVCIEVEDDAFSADLESRKRSLRISRNVLRPLIG
ncbi:MAG: sugar phosphate isomerase/epimerase, partial [Planctomycetales bacterium]